MDECMHAVPVCVAASLGPRLAAVRTLRGPEAAWASPRGGGRRVPPPGAQRRQLEQCALQGRVPARSQRRASRPPRTARPGGGAGDPRPGQGPVPRTRGRFSSATLAPRAVTGPGPLGTPLHCAGEYRAWGRRAGSLFPGTPQTRVGLRPGRRRQISSRNLSGSLGLSFPSCSR